MVLKDSSIDILRFFFAVFFWLFEVETDNLRLFFGGRSARAFCSAREARIYVRRAKRASNLRRAKRLSLFCARRALTFVQRSKRVFFRGARSALAFLRRAKRSTRLAIFSGWVAAARRPEQTTIRGWVAGVAGATEATDKDHTGTGASQTGIADQIINDY